MIEVELPDGRILEVDTTDQNAAVKAAQSYLGGQQQPPQPGFTDKLAGLWDKPPAGPSLIGMAKSVWEGMKAPGQAVSGELNVPMPGLRREDFTDAPRPSGLMSPVAWEPNSELIDKSMGLAGATMLGTTGAPAGALGSGMIRRQSPLQNPITPPDPAFQAAESLGVQIPKFLATDDMITQRMAAGVKNIPGAGDEIYRATQNTVDSMGDAARNIQRDLGSGSPEVAGRSAKDNIESWVTGKSKDISKRGYDSVDRLVDNNLVRPLHATLEAVSEIAAKRAAAKIQGKSAAVDAVLPAVQSEGMSYQGLKDLRSFIGEMTPQEMIAKNISKKEADRLYGALSEDLKGTILDAGGPQALTAFEKANTVHRDIVSRRKALSSIIGAKADAAPEAVFSKLVAMAGSRQTADIAKLSAAKKSMGADAWREVGSAVVAKIGRDPQDQFSPERFLTAFGNYSPDAKKLLFAPEHAKALNELNALSVFFKDRISKFGNPSGTAQNMQGASIVQQITHEPLKLLSTLVGGNAIARSLSEPATAQSMAKWARTYVAVSAGPSPTSRAAFEAATRNLVSAIGGDGDLLRKVLSVVPAPAQNNGVLPQRERQQ
jgi:hypothetical protein